MVLEDFTRFSFASDRVDFVINPCILLPTPVPETKLKPIRTSSV